MEMKKLKILQFPEGKRKESLDDIIENVILLLKLKLIAKVLLKKKKL